MILDVNKPLGWTMLDLTNYYKGELNVDKVSFAGRLDPLATGCVKILTHEDLTKNIELSRGYKKYSFSFLRNIQTDTYDILGIPRITDKTKEIDVGMYEQEYPPYSSVIVKEYKLPYWLCMKRNLEVLNPPRKTVEIKEIKLIDTFKISKDELLKEITEQFNKLTKKTFRANEILEEWKKLDIQEIEIENYETFISSGCYVRWICNEKGGCAMNINRTLFC